MTALRRASPHRLLCGGTTSRELLHRAAASHHYRTEPDLSSLDRSTPPRGRCVFYRAEPGFLLQGGMRAVVPPNSRCRAFPGGPADCTDPQERPGGKMMEKGQVAWAGGSAGPDLFILMGRNGFGATHTVWGELADEASLALELVQAPIEKGLKPGSMRMIADPISFTVHVV